MKDRNHLVYASLALVGGIFGGAVSGHWFPPTGADAAVHASRALRAEKFVLVDHDGKERGVFDVNKLGEAQIALMDDSGRSRAEFQVGGNGAGAIAFYDQHGNKRVVLGASPSERNGLGIYSKSGRQIAGFTAAEYN